MSRSKHAVELCALLVDETYGELSSRIFTILLRKGRQPLKSLSQNTRLTQRMVRHGLVVLIQQNLVYHSLDITNHMVYYEANHDAAYGLIRSGKIMEVVESRYGGSAKDVIQTLFELGNIKVSDLVESFQTKEKKKFNENTNGNGHITDSGVNGAKNHNKTRSKSAAQVHAILIQLLEVGFVEAVIKDMLRGPTDTYNHYEREILTADYGGSTAGIKQKDEVKAKIRARFQAERNKGQNWKQQEGKKRPIHGGISHGMNGSGKRRRLSNGAVNGDHAYEDDGARLDPNLIVRINYEKCTVALRSHRLVELANIRIGEITSQVYAEVLRIMEENIPRCRLDPKIDDVDDITDGPSVTTVEVAASLSRSIDVGLGIGKTSGDSNDNESKKGRKDDASENEEESGGEGNTNGELLGFDKEFDDSDDPFADDYVAKAPKRPKVTFQEKLPKPGQPHDRQNRTDQIKEHLSLLAGDGTCKFLRKNGTRGQGEWTVDFEGIIQQLQEAELDQMLLENFGRGGHRLGRIMRKLGKLEEKQLPTLALMKQKDIRTKLAEMQMAGMVDIQEVPRDNSRTISRTMFLWYFDSARVSAILVDSLYKCMSRCLQRLDVEKRRAHDVLAITERSDVIASGEPPENYLEPDMLTRLRDAQAKKDSLLCQLGRLDELVGIFRDY